VAAIKTVITGTAAQFIVAAATLQPVVTIPAVNEIIASATIDIVASGTANQMIVTPCSAPPCHIRSSLCLPPKRAFRLIPTTIQARGETKPLATIVPKGGTAEQ
jgi:hypothetical protein